MPLSGTKPSETPIRRRNKPTHEWTEVEHVPFEDAPPMPSGRWPAATRRWWGVVSRMPHCVLWEDDDWEFARQTMVVSAAFNRGDVKAATELRQREKIMGVTMDARRDLRIRYVDPRREEVPAGVTAIAEYRRMLAE